MNDKTRKRLPNYVIIVFVVICLGTNLYHHRWTRDEGPFRGVIVWDVISYYAYLPAAFMYHDLTLDFVDDPEFNNDNKIWYHTLENGNRLIVTSMGLSYLYAPFFLMAHALAPVFNEPRSGYNSIYQLFLVLGSLFYVTAGLIYLKKILLRYFSHLVTAATLLVITLGTNLYYYATFDAALVHAFNFALITLFLYLTIRWYERPTLKHAVLTGLLFGLITLIRPTNILVFLVLFLWGVTSRRDLARRITFYVKQYPRVLLMMACFLLVWIPQFLYWKLISGQYLFYSYGPHGGHFYWGDPNLIPLLFSYKKGWFVYTPLMLFAVAGIPFLWHRARESTLTLAVFVPLMIYLQASWWSWWFGGCFGSRVFVDAYGLLALPFAAFLSFTLERRSQLAARGFPVLVGLLILYQVFQSFQYYKGAIHFMGMNKEAYWETFLKMKTTGRFWEVLTMPDPVLGRLGIYVYYRTGEDTSWLEEVDRQEALARIRQEMQQDKALMKDIRQHARRAQISQQEALEMVANRIYEYKKNN